MEVVTGRIPQPGVVQPHHPFKLVKEKGASHNSKSTLRQKSMVCVHTLR